MIICSPQTSQKGTMISRVWIGTWDTTFDQYEVLMIKDGESHAIIHEMDIVYMQVSVTGTLTEYDARDRSHGSGDL